MRQVAQIAEHASVLNRRLLAALVRLVLGVWTHEAEDALQHRRRQLSDEISSSRCRKRDRGSVLEGGDLRDGVLVVLFLVLGLVVLGRVHRLGLLASLLEPVHDAVSRQAAGWRWKWGIEGCETRSKWNSIARLLGGGKLEINTSRRRSTPDPSTCIPG